MVILELGIYIYKDVKCFVLLCDGFLIGSLLMVECDLEVVCCKVILGENKVCGLICL